METIALVGNPNTGKTTFFNALTKSNSHIGNWHGVTTDVEIKKMNDDFFIADLAGTYSLSPFSLEEKNTSNYLMQNDVKVLNLCEQINLARNLMLTLQLIEVGFEVSLVVNTFGNFQNYDNNVLSEMLGCCVNFYNFSNKNLKNFVPCFKVVKTNICDYLNKLPFKEILSILAKVNLKLEERQPKQCNCISCKKNCKSIMQIQKNAKSTIDKFIALRLLEGDDSFLVHYDLTEQEKDNLSKIQKNIDQQKIFQLRNEKIKYILEKAKLKTPILIDEKIKKSRLKIDKNAKIAKMLDKVFINNYFAFPFFLFLMFCIFFLTFGPVGGFLSSQIENLFLFVLSPLGNFLQSQNLMIFYRIYADVLVGGVGTIVNFLPQVMLLFLCLTILEESGYMSRLAYILECVCQKIGLSGKSVFTFLMGYGCTASALMTAQNLDSKQAKLKTILCLPFVPCSAKLPVFAVIGGAFFGDFNIFVIFILYIISSLLGLLVVNLLDKSFLPTKDLPFMLEFPQLRLPKFKVVFKSTMQSIKQFLLKICVFLLLFSFIIWFLQNFNWKLHFTNGQSDSILKSISQFIAPIFSPLGFGNWGAVSALFAGLVAKELVVSTIGILNNSGSVESIVQESITNSASVVNFDPYSAFSFLLFCLLYTPCIATISAMRSQIGTKWTIFSAILQFLVAYICSFLVYTFAVSLF